VNQCAIAKAEVILMLGNMLCGLNLCVSSDEFTKMRGSKYEMTYVRIYINKQISPIFDCVTPDSILLSSLACQFI